jgi:hypothetical protein
MPTSAALGPQACEAQFQYVEQAAGEKSGVSRCATGDVPPPVQGAFRTCAVHSTLSP